MTPNGLYIVGEGHDATGKTTAIDRLAKRVSDLELEVLRFDEPGGNEMADAIRSTVLDARIPRYFRTDTLLFGAARSDAWYLKAESVLARGGIVLASRSYESTKIFQVAEGESVELVEALTRLTMPPRYVRPDAFLLFYLRDEAERERRLSLRPPSMHPDTFETKGPAFQKAVYERYMLLAQKPGVLLVDASGTPEEVEELAWKKIEPLVMKRLKATKKQN